MLGTLDVAPDGADHRSGFLPSRFRVGLRRFRLRWRGRRRENARHRGSDVHDIAHGIRRDQREQNCHSRGCATGHENSRGDRRPALPQRRELFERLLFVVISRKKGRGTIVAICSGRRPQLVCRQCSRSPPIIESVVLTIAGPMITFRHGDTPATLTQLGNLAKATVMLLDQFAPATGGSQRFESAQKATAAYRILKRLRFEYVATVA